MDRQDGRVVHLNQLIFFLNCGSQSRNFLFLASNFVILVFINFSELADLVLEVLHLLIKALNLLFKALSLPSSWLT